MSRLTPSSSDPASPLQSSSSSMDSICEAIDKARGSGKAGLLIAFNKDKYNIHYMQNSSDIDHAIQSCKNGLTTQADFCSVDETKTNDNKQEVGKGGSECKDIKRKANVVGNDGSNKKRELECYGCSQKVYTAKIYDNCGCVYCDECVFFCKGCNNFKCWASCDQFQLCKSEDGCGKCIECCPTVQSGVCVKCSTKLNYNYITTNTNQCYKCRGCYVYCPECINKMDSDAFLRCRKCNDEPDKCGCCKKELKTVKKQYGMYQNVPYIKEVCRVCKGCEDCCRSYQKLSCVCGSFIRVCDGLGECIYECTKCKGCLVLCEFSCSDKERICFNCSVE